MIFLMRIQEKIWLVVWLLVPIMIVSGSAALAGSEATDNPTVVERIGSTAKKVGNNIEQGFSRTVQKIEGKHIGDKIERKLKKAATKTAEGFKKAEEKINQKLR